MPKKFDTNPLDPEFPKKVAEAQRDETAYKLTAETQNFPNNVATDEQTRRFEEAQFQSYANVPNYQPPAVYQNQFMEMNQPINRKVEKIGLSENIVIALPYLPWGIGLVAGLVELLLVPRTEPKARFHAAQGMALHIGIWLITAILGFAGIASNWAGFGNGLFQLVMMICSFVWAYKAYKGKPIHLEALDDLTNWLEEKIRIK
ncbi:MAG TPA: hypothetical protein PKY82_02920 [Pyrinomonadaceae bacterium]|nr:hypothetical protein [Pyrinomonadaceae bacterium]